MLILGRLFTRLEGGRQEGYLYFLVVRENRLTTPLLQHIEY